MLAFPLLSVTARPPAGAAPLNETVHVELPGAFTVAGLHVNPLNCTTGDTVTVAVLLTPLAVAVTVTVCALDTVAAVALKDPEAAPEATVTLAGTGNATLLLDRVTVSALVAAFVSVTVHVVLCPDVTVDGEQATVDSWAGAEALRVKVLDTPPLVAVSSAV
jgi:hypothetical protein